MTVQEVRWRLEYFAFRVAACFIEALSVRQTIRLAEFVAWLLTCVLPKKLSRYDVAYANIEQALGDTHSPQEIDHIIRRMWVHLIRVVAETIQFPRKVSLENYRDVVVVRNRALACEAMSTGRPIFLLGGHYGNWEASIGLFGIFGYRYGVVARQLDNPYLHEWFRQARENTGHKLLLKQGGWDGMVDIMEAGGNLGLLCDQDAGKRGLFVDFFGQPASTYKSFALMAMQYNALLIVGYCRRLPDDLDNSRWVRYEIGCEEVIDPQKIEGDEIRTITQLYSSALERAIRRSPEQYFWVHRRWKSQPGKKKEKRRKAAA